MNWRTSQRAGVRSGPDSRPVAGPFTMTGPVTVTGTVSSATGAALPPTAGQPHAEGGVANSPPHAEPPVAAGSAPVPPTAGQPRQGFGPGEGGGGRVE